MLLNKTCVSGGFRRCCLIKFGFLMNFIGLAEQIAVSSYSFLKDFIYQIGAVSRLTPPPPPLISIDR